MFSLGYIFDDVTCFSKALGTSLLSSDRLWLIRSLRLFSIIYANEGQRRRELSENIRRDDQDMDARIESKIDLRKEEKKSEPKKQSTSLTPLLFLRAKI